jgi:RNA polymerase sigma factor (sigma-70 family)
VSDADREALRSVWRRLRQRYDWQLVDDEEVFLDEALALKVELLSQRRTTPREVVTPWEAVFAAYSVRMYRGIWRREERAAQELWTYFVALALARGATYVDAEDIAQEAVLRVLDQLPTLRRPHCLIGWGRMILRTVWDWLARQRKHEMPLQQATDEQPKQYADSFDLSEVVEQRMISQELSDLLAQALPIKLEREVLVLWALMGDKPREIAALLGIDARRVSVAKYRALKHLHKHPTVMQRLQDLRAADGGRPDQGDPNDE